MADGRLGLIFPTLIGAATVLASVWQFSTTARMNAKEPFLRKQLDACFDIAEITAKIGTTSDPAVFGAAVSRFWEFYWGQLAIVENRAVEVAMIDFGESLRRLPADAAKPAAELQPKALRIAHECRDLVLRSWGIDLGPLGGRS